jgi:hypothetical protein
LLNRLTVAEASTAKFDVAELKTSSVLGDLLSILIEAGWWSGYGEEGVPVTLGLSERKQSDPIPVSKDRSSMAAGPVKGGGVVHTAV